MGLLPHRRHLRRSRIWRPGHNQSRRKSGILTMPDATRPSFTESRSASAHSGIARIRTKESTHKENTHKIISGGFRFAAISEGFPSSKSQTAPCPPSGAGLKVYTLIAQGKTASWQGYEIPMYFRGKSSKQATSLSPSPTHAESKGDF